MFTDHSGVHPHARLKVICTVLFTEPCFQQSNQSRLPRRLPISSRLQHKTASVILTFLQRNFRFCELTAGSLLELSVVLTVLQAVNCPNESDDSLDKRTSGQRVQSSGTRACSVDIRHVTFAFKPSAVCAVVELFPET